MEATTTAAPPGPAAAAADRTPEPVLGRALLPGMVLLGNSGGSWVPRFADERAMALFGCRDGAELAARWTAIQPCLEASWETSAAELELPAAVTGSRRLRVAMVRVDGSDAAGGEDGAGGEAGAAAAAGSTGAAGSAYGAALLVQDAELRAAIESDLRAASLMRSLAQVTPAVAHDLRAPINAMVLNLEVLKETLAAGPGAPASAAGRDPRERQQRYVSVLREELARLHRSLELFLAHISPRGDRLETLDLREPAQDLAALLLPPARKQQARIELLLPDAPVPVLAQRHQLRQALLHLGLAALAQVPRDGTLEIRLDRRRGAAVSPESESREAPAAAKPQTRAASEAPATMDVARLRITAAAQLGAGGIGAAGQPAPSPAGAGPEPRFTAAGTEARLEVARSILAALGGALRQEAFKSGEPRLGSAFEIRFPLRESN
jgi:signal transduction histidine kinase